MVDCFDVKGCEVVLKVYFCNKLFIKDVKLDIIVKCIIGFFGVDFENFLNEVVLFVVCCNRRDIFMCEVDEVIDCVIVGMEKKSCVISDWEKWIVVYYEVGYIIVGYFLEYVDMVYKVIIILCGCVGGYVIMLLKEDCMLVIK